ncbi:MAG: hypothetical protein F4074_07930 [Synechococcus sp. SB0672_bin_10]|nr:hypothetical protein [Synechococcus sp. SB0672_bin_10]
MCAILDANAAHEVFGSNAGQATEAGRGFFQWLKDGKGSLVVGGKLKQELDQGVPGFRIWASQAILAGQLVNVDDHRVNDKTKDVKKHGGLQSDDPHVIALAQVSGARLLFSNDKGLHKDFKNPDIINNGKIYSTARNRNFTSHKRSLLEKHRCRLGS